jgi:hypothetical protein
MAPAIIFTTNGEIMALKSKQTGLPEEFEENEEKPQVSFDDLGLEAERVDIDEEAEEKTVYYTISGKEQDYQPTWETFNIKDLDVGDEFEGKPEVTIFEKEDKSYNAVRVRLLDNGEILNLYFNYPKKNYPVVRNLKNIRTGEKDDFDFYLNCFDVVFSTLKCIDESKVTDSNGKKINKIKAINLEVLLKIIDTSKNIGIRVVEGSPYNDYLSWGIIKME